MATYLYRCDEGHLISTYAHGIEGLVACGVCGGPLTRDYRAEGVGVQVVGLKREREAGGRKAVRDLFLPSAKDFEGPQDPDGTKGIRKWADEHGPRSGNSKPLYPDMPKKVF